MSPQEPENASYLQRDTLADGNRPWFRADFFHQHRLFFRFRSRHRTIILAWVSDEKAKRAHGARVEASQVF